MVSKGRKKTAFFVRGLTFSLSIYLAIFGVVTKPPLALAVEEGSEEQSPAEESTPAASQYSTASLLGSPRYTYLRPRWAIILSGGHKALGNINFGQSAGGSSVSKVFSLGLEYQPKSWQDYGVFGVGVAGSLYPTVTRTTTDVTDKPYSVWSAGFNVRYQLRYWHEQLLVPFVNFTVQRLYYDVNNGPKGFTTFYGPSAGLQFYLNRLEPSVSADAYVDTGILRSYLFFEGQKLSGENENFALGGYSYLLGLRAEF